MPKRTVGALKLAGESTLACTDTSQVPEMLGRINKHRDVGVTEEIVMYSWIGRRIQPLQKCTRFGFEYLGVLDQS